MATALAACCAVSTACSILTSTVSLLRMICGCGGSSRVSMTCAKVMHLIMIFVSATIALVLYTYADNFQGLLNNPVMKNYCGTDGAQCVGVSAVLRISLGLFCFYALMMLVTTFSRAAFTNFWSLKVLAWIAIVIGCFFIPGEKLTGYGQFARIMSVFWLIAQAIIFIDFAHTLEEWLMHKINKTTAELLQKYEEIGLCQNCWRWLYVFITFALLIASFVGIVLLYNFSTNRPAGVSCDENVGFLSETLALAVVYLVLSQVRLSPAVTRTRGLIVPSIVCAYCVWLVWSAIYSQPNAACNPLPPNTNDTGATIVGMIIAALSLCYTAFSTANSVPGMFDGMKANNAKPGDDVPSASGATAPLSPDTRGPTPATSGGGAVVAAATTGTSKASDYGSTTAAVEGGATASTTASAANVEIADEAETKKPKGNAAAYSPSVAGHGEDGPELPYHPKDAIIFMIVIMLGSLYLAPVITNWATDAASVAQSRASVAGMWVSMGSQFFITLLYLWTIIAPVCCPNRDFS